MGVGWAVRVGQLGWPGCQLGRLAQWGSLFFSFVFTFIYFTFSVLVLFPIILVLLKYTRSI